MVDRNVGLRVPALTDEYIFYLGNSLEHYMCHGIWIVDTGSVLVGQTVFLDHKYLTQPSVTPNNAVLCASGTLCQIPKGLPPTNGDTRTSVDMLMDIFKNSGAKDDTKVDKQRTRMGTAATKQT